MTRSLFRTGFATLALALAGTSLALARPDVSHMTCAEAQALVLEAGGIVVTTGPNTYQRFVSTRRACEPQNHYLHPAFTPTRDARACRIGYTCENYSYYFSDD